MPQAEIAPGSRGLTSALGPLVVFLGTAAAWALHFRRRTTPRDPMGLAHAATASRLALCTTSGVPDPDHVIEVDAVVVDKNRKMEAEAPRDDAVERGDGSSSDQLGFGASSSQSSYERQQLFNGIAPVYDVLNDALSLGQHRLWKAQTVGWAQAAQGGYVLDLCCGSGDLAQLLALKVGPFGRVAAIDFAADMLERGRRRTTNPLNGPINLLSAPIDWIQADALKLPFGDNTFNAATMGYGLRNVVSIPDAFTEIKRVLQPGAKAAILDFHKPSDERVANFQRLYLDNLVVPAATLAGMKEEYEYIMPSLEAFPTGPEQEMMAIEAGFTSATHHELAGGLMGCLVVMK